MKVIYFFLPFIVLACTGQKTVPLSGTGDNGKTSLDWVGTYKGVLPCADCEGIYTLIQLKKDLTYSKSTQYLGKSSELFTQNGSFQWNKEGHVITLIPWEREGQKEGQDNRIEVKDEFKEPQGNVEQYSVEEHQLRKLDESGRKIEGSLAQKYVLAKYNFDEDIREKYWKLIELNGKTIVFSETQKRETHFVLRTNDKRMLGHGGCNTFSGSYELLQGNRIRFSELTSTEIFCTDVSYEPDFFTAIQNADNYTIKEDTLSLNKARMSPLAKYKAVYFR